MTLKVYLFYLENGFVIHLMPSVPLDQLKYTAWYTV